MNAIDIPDEESDVVVIDLRDDNVLKLIRRLEIETARHINKRHRFSTQGKQAVNIGMCLGHCCHRCPRNDLAHLCNIDTVVHLPYAELDNLKFVCPRLKQDSLFFFDDRICHLSLSPYS